MSPLDACYYLLLMRDAMESAMTVVRLVVSHVLSLVLSRVSRCH